jgi:hypothetical protein
MPAKPKLTRMHFQFFADCIKDAVDRSSFPTADRQQSLFSADDLAVLGRFARETATRMSDTNPAFDRKRFLTACGV